MIPSDRGSGLRVKQDERRYAFRILRAEAVKLYRPEIDTTCAEASEFVVEALPTRRAIRNDIE